jgi:hypothetical protein
MFLIGLGALLVLGGILYMARAAIWRGPLSGPESSRPVPDTLEPPRRGYSPSETVDLDRLFIDLGSPRLLSHRTTTSRPARQAIAACRY